MMSFVVPAHNEEALLPQTLHAIKAAVADLAEAAEVVVVDDASTDQTAAVAQEAGARVIQVVVRQIATARNAGARAATGELLCFVDADTTITRAAVVAARQAVQDGAVGGGCAVRFDGPLPLWARVCEPLARWGSRYAGMAPGCFLFCSREGFLAVGGFDETVFAGEEAVMSRRLRRVGRFVVLREEVVTSGRKLRAYSGWEIARAMGGLALRGRRGVQDRRRLDLWYGPRRPDPARERATPAPDALDA